MIVKATVFVFTTTAGDYGLHGQTGWDDLPYWEYYPAWIVAIEVEGKLDWGPYKYRRNAKRTHSGTTSLALRSAYCHVAWEKTEADKEIQQRAAEDQALELAEALDENGFDVSIVLAEDHCRTDLDRKYARWIAAPPPERFQKQVLEIFKYGFFRKLLKEKTSILRPLESDEATSAHC